MWPVIPFIRPCSIIKPFVIVSTFQFFSRIINFTVVSLGLNAFPFVNYYSSYNPLSLHFPYSLISYTQPTSAPNPYASLFRCKTRSHLLNLKPDIKAGIRPGALMPLSWTGSAIWSKCRHALSQTTPRHATPRYATAYQVTPRHATPRHAT